MFQYIEHIIVPYVTATRESFEADIPALVIIDNFKGQITSGITALLEVHNIHVCLLPPNTTDLLQPMDLSVNKPAKDFLKQRFEEWYAHQVMSQLDGNEGDSPDIEPVNLGLPMLKELGAKLLVQMAEYFSENPHLIVNGFVKAGIAGALDHRDSSDQEDQGEAETESDFGISEDEHGDTEVQHM